MSKLRKKDCSYLEAAFGNRVSFDRVERKLHGHDIAVFPSLFKPLIGKTIPDAVVQPENEQELVEVVKWARKRGIPLTPRGKASSGYGGVLPVKAGIVVDFFRLNTIVQVDPSALTARVQGGVLWEKLDRELAKHDLTLRLYPTSYPSSTVGGWLAQGGAGIGSFEAGWFKENVLSARVVMPNGDIREFSGTDLDLVADAEGTTGFISEVTVRVQPLENLDVVAVSSPTAHDLQGLAQAIVDRHTPIWSLVFINPKMAELKNRTPVSGHNGHSVEEQVHLPATYITTLAFRQKDRDAVMNQLGEVMKSAHSRLLRRRYRSPRMGESI